MNIATHGRKVHTGHAGADGRPVITCGLDTGAQHLAVETSRPVSCARCLTILANAARKADLPARQAPAPRKAPKVTRRPTAELAATVGNVQIVRHVEDGGTVWTLHHGGPAFMVALSKREALTIAGRQ